MTPETVLGVVSFAAFVLAIVLTLATLHQQERATRRRSAFNRPQF